MAKTRSAKGSGRRRGEESAGRPAEDGDRTLVCNVAFCPLCLAVTSAHGAAPDAVEHLLKAAQEFFLAARAVIDVRAELLDGRRPPGPTRLEKIEIV